MMFLRWISVLFFTAVSVFLLWFGFTYMTVDKLLWFHAAAVPEEAQEAIRPLYFALMNLVGGSSLGLGTLSLFVTATSLRKGMRGAGSALSISLAAAFIIAAITAEELAEQTGAPTSWHIMGILLLVTMVGWAAQAASMASSDV
jgi:hypothetical protein